MKKVGIIIGSLRQGSYNRQIAETFIKIGHPHLDFSVIDISQLPLFSQDLEGDVPSSVETFRQDIRSNDLILIITPEYNRSIPGVLKNALDWGSRPYAKSAFTGKQAAIAGVSPGAIGTAAAQVHLRSILPCIGLTLIRQPEMYITWTQNLLTPDGLPQDDKTTLFFKKFLDALAQ